MMMKFPEGGIVYDYERYVPEHFASHRGDGVKEFKKRHSRCVARMALENAENILDIGGGSGELTALLALRGFAVTYLDVSEKAAEFARGICRAALPAEAFERIRFMTGDLAGPGAAALIGQLGDNQDLAVCINVWEHLPPSKCLALVRNALRLLRPGGRMHIETGPNRIVGDALRRLARWGFGVSGGYKDSHVHINEQSYWSFRKALASVPDGRFRVRAVRHPGWIYGEARCAAAPGGRPVLKAALPLIRCISAVMDGLTFVPGLKQLLSYGLCAVSAPKP